MNRVRQMPIWWRATAGAVAVIVAVIVFVIRTSREPVDRLLRVLGVGGLGERDVGDAEGRADFPSIEET